MDAIAALEAALREQGIPVLPRVPRHEILARKLGHAAGRIRSRRCRCGAAAGWALPDALWEMSDLTLLALAEDPLTSISGRIGDLIHLTHLYIYNTEVATLPESMGSLRKLSVLDLGHNKLTTAPESLANLPDLIFST
ncbi:MAG: hypothetical protein U0521_22725 [Anaerolineae bacterium]